MRAVRGMLGSSDIGVICYDEKANFTRWQQEDVVADNGGGIDLGGAGLRPAEFGRYAQHDIRFEEYRA